MEYKGKLYGEANGVYWPLVEGTDDFEYRNALLLEAREELVWAVRHIGDHRQTGRAADVVAKIDILLYGQGDGQWEQDAE